MQRGGFCEKMLWTHAPFVSRIFNIVFHEGHCICQWGSTFRPEYKQVGTLRYLLPNIPFYITSATIPPAMISDLKEILHLSKDCLVLRRSNDRHNVTFCVRKMRHPLNSYEDLAFLIPKSWKLGDAPPKKFMVFFNNKREAESACLFLRSRLPHALRHKLKWFHAGMTTFYRTEEMEDFVKGRLWGLTMTDVGGMVCWFLLVISLSGIEVSLATGDRHS